VAEQSPLNLARICIPNDDRMLGFFFGVLSFAGAIKTLVVTRPFVPINQVLYEVASYLLLIISQAREIADYNLGLKLVFVRMFIRPLIARRNNSQTIGRPGADLDIVVRMTPQSA
jgi:hypothetical protein